MKKKTKIKSRHPYRLWMTLMLVLCCFSALSARAFYLQILNSDYLRQAGEARFSRIITDQAVRGIIYDRNGKPLAVSTPVESVWADTTLLDARNKNFQKLAGLLKINEHDLRSKISKNRGKEFMYVKRHVPPDLAAQVMALEIPGIALQREYRRYYPAGPITAHALGFTNIDDVGQEGAELAYDAWLKGKPGKRQVHKDRHGKVIETVETLSVPVPGKALVTSIDYRIQYLAYRELKAAMQAHGARAAMAVLCKIDTGEILAIVNLPDFNPNKRQHKYSARFRNRIATDIFEPGSTFKPFTVLAALETRRYKADSVIHTAPGYIQVSGKTIKDIRNYGDLTVAGIIQKSSNVGATKIALDLKKKQMWSIYEHFGFGQITGSALPGESSGILHPYKAWVRLDQASLSFGYGISVTALQMIRAYMAIADDGLLKPLSLLKQDEPIRGKQIIKAGNANKVREMLELVVSDDGTARAAQIPYYSVAGKTGTVKKLDDEGYTEKKYLSSFIGFAPASRPELIMFVVVDEPVNGQYFGGQVAAPVFSRVMAGALRLLSIAPDEPMDSPSIVHKRGEYDNNG